MMRQFVLAFVAFFSLNLHANSILGDLSLNCINGCIFPAVGESKSLPVRTFDTMIKIDEKNLQLILSSTMLLTEFIWDFELDSQDRILENGKVIGKISGLEFNFKSTIANVTCTNQVGTNPQFFNLLCSILQSGQWLQLEGKLAM